MPEDPAVAAGVGVDYAALMEEMDAESGALGASGPTTAGQTDYAALYREMDAIDQEVKGADPTKPAAASGPVDYAALYAEMDGERPSSPVVAPVAEMAQPEQADPLDQFSMADILMERRRKEVEAVGGVALTDISPEAARERVVGYNRETGQAITDPTPLTRAFNSFIEQFYPFGLGRKIAPQPERTASSDWGERIGEIGGGTLGMLASFLLPTAILKAARVPKLISAGVNAATTYGRKLVAAEKLAEGADKTILAGKAALALGGIDKAASAAATVGRTATAVSEAQKAVTALETIRKSEPVIYKLANGALQNWALFGLHGQIQADIDTKLEDRVENLKESIISGTLFAGIGATQRALEPVLKKAGSEVVASGLMFGMGYGTDDSVPEEDRVANGFAMVLLHALGQYSAGKNRAQMAAKVRMLSQEVGIPPETGNRIFSELVDDPRVLKRLVDDGTITPQIAAKMTEAAKESPLYKTRKAQAGVRERLDAAQGKDARRAEAAKLYKEWTGEDAPEPKFTVKDAKGNTEVVTRDKIGKREVVRVDDSEFDAAFAREEKVVTGGSGEIYKDPNVLAPRDTEAPPMVPGRTEPLPQSGAPIQSKALGNVPPENQRFFVVRDVDGREQTVGEGEIKKGQTIVRVIDTVPPAEASPVVPATSGPPAPLPQSKAPIRSRALGNEAPNPAPVEKPSAAPAAATAVAPQPSIPSAHANEPIPNLEEIQRRGLAPAPGAPPAAPAVTPPAVAAPPAAPAPAVAPPTSQPLPEVAPESRVAKIGNMEMTVGQKVVNRNTGEVAEITKITTSRRGKDVAWYRLPGAKKDVPIYGSNSWMTEAEAASNAARGGEIRARIANPDPKLAAVLPMETGQTRPLSEIARELGVSENEARQMLRDAGYAVPDARKGQKSPGMVRNKGTVDAARAANRPGQGAVEGGNRIEDGVDLSSPSAIMGEKETIKATLSLRVMEEQLTRERRAPTAKEAAQMDALRAETTPELQQLGTDALASRLAALEGKTPLAASNLKPPPAPDVKIEQNVALASHLDDVAKQNGAMLNGLGIDPKTTPLAEIAAARDRLLLSPEMSTREGRHRLSVLKDVAETRRIMEGGRFETPSDQPMMRDPRGETSRRMDSFAKEHGGVWTPAKAGNSSIGTLRFGDWKVEYRIGKQPEGKSGVFRERLGSEFVIEIDPENGRVTTPLHEVLHFGLRATRTHEATMLSKALGFDVREIGGEEQLVSRMMTREGRREIANALRNSAPASRYAVVRWLNRTIDLVNRTFGTKISRIGDARDWDKIAKTMEDLTIFDEMASGKRIGERAGSVADRYQDDPRLNLLAAPLWTARFRGLEARIRQLREDTRLNPTIRMPFPEWKDLDVRERSSLQNAGFTLDVNRMGKPMLGISQNARADLLRATVQANRLERERAAKGQESARDRFHTTGPTPFQALVKNEAEYVAKRKAFRAQFADGGRYNPNSTEDFKKWVNEPVDSGLKKVADEVNAEIGARSAGKSSPMSDWRPAPLRFVSKVMSMARAGMSTGRTKAAMISSKVEQVFADEQSAWDRDVAKINMESRQRMMAAKDMLQSVGIWKVVQDPDLGRVELGDVSKFLRIVRSQVVDREGKIAKGRSGLDALVSSGAIRGREELNHILRGVGANASEAQVRAAKEKIVAMAGRLEARYPTVKAGSAFDQWVSGQFGWLREKMVEALERWNADHPNDKRTIEQVMDYASTARLRPEKGDFDTMAQSMMAQRSNELIGDTFRRYGMTRDRKGGQSDPVLLSNIFEDLVNQSRLVAELQALPGKDRLAKFLGSIDHEAVTRMYGADFMRSLYKDLAISGTAHTRDNPKFLRWMAHGQDVDRFSDIMLSANQFASMPVVASRYGIRNAMKGLKMGFATNFRSGSLKIDNADLQGLIDAPDGPRLYNRLVSSGGMQELFESRSVSEAEQFAGYRTRRGAILSKVRDIGTTPIRFVDRTTVLTAMGAALESGREKGLTGKALYEWAARDSADFINSTQPVGDKAHKTSLQNNPWGGLYFSRYMTVPNAVGNDFWRSAIKVRRGEIPVSELGKKFVYNIILPALTLAVVSKAKKEGREDLAQLWASDSEDERRKKLMAATNNSPAADLLADVITASIGQIPAPVGNLVARPLDAMFLEGDKRMMNAKLNSLGQDPVTGSWFQRAVAINRSITQIRNIRNRLDAGDARSGDRDALERHWAKLFNDSSSLFGEMSHLPIGAANRTFGNPLGYGAGRIAVENYNRR